MARAIFIIYACYVGANDGFSSLSGYPKVFDSNSYGGDTELTRKRAYADYWDCLGAMGKIDTRKVQEAMIIDVISGIQIEVFRIGDLNPAESGEYEDILV